VLKVLKRPKVEPVAPTKARPAVAAQPPAGAPEKPRPSWASFSQQLMGRLDSATHGGSTLPGQTGVKPGLPNSQG